MCGTAGQMWDEDRRDHAFFACVLWMCLGRSCTGLVLLRQEVRAMYKTRNRFHPYLMDLTPSRGITRRVRRESRQAYTLMRVPNPVQNLRELTKERGRDVQRKTPLPVHCSHNTRKYRLRFRCDDLGIADEDREHQAE